MRVAHCPGAAELEQLIVGGLDEEEAQTRESHVLGCSTCLETLRSLTCTRDPLATLLREESPWEQFSSGSVVEHLVQQLKAMRHPAELIDPRSHSHARGLDTPLHGQADTDDDLRLADFLAPPQAEGELGRVGKYRILKVLGRGGMGVVFQAEDSLLNRSVALKAALPTLAATGNSRKRFLREARAMAAVEHDHIVRIYEVAEAEGVPYLAMELLKGELLEARLARDGKQPLLEVVRIGKEIALGLQAAHQQGLVHRDIKPSNIWLEAPKGRVKILDFGLARLLEQQPVLTQQGAIIGTPAYMAPEQACGGAVDARSDLFSLGVILYQLCCGQRAFRGNDAVSALMAVASQQPPPAIHINPSLPPELSDLVMELLQKDPTRRPPSAGAVTEALQGVEKALLSRPGTQEQTLPSRTVPKEKLSAARRSRLPLLIGWLVLLAGLVGAGLGVSALIRISHERGDLVLETDDPDFAFSVVKKGAVTLEDRKTKRTYRVKVVPQGKDDYELEVTDAGAELSFNSRTFTIRRGDKVALKAWFERNSRVAVQPMADAPWRKRVAAMPPEKQVEAVTSRLRELNSGFGWKVWHQVEKGIVTRLTIRASRLRDVSPVRALTGLRNVILDQNKIVDLVPLRGLPLTDLSVAHCPVVDLTPLREMPLARLNLAFTKVADLSPLKGLPLTSLDLEGTNVRDLSPLAGMKLRSFYWSKTSVADLSVLRGMPLRNIGGDLDPKRDGTLLRSFPNLETINGRPARGVALELTGYDAKGEIPSLRTDAAEEVTMEARVTHVGHNEGAIVGTPHFVLRLRGVLPAVRFDSRAFETWILGPDEVGGMPGRPSLSTHLAAVKSAAGLRLFVDGKLVGQRDATGPFRLDAAEAFGLGGGGLGLWLHEVRISRRARYGGDFTPQTPLDADADTLALYRCDEGEGNVLNDASGNGHHGRLTATRWMRGWLDAPAWRPIADAGVKEVAALPVKKPTADPRVLLDWVVSKNKDALSLQLGENGKSRWYKHQKPRGPFTVLGVYLDKVRTDTITDEDMARLAAYPDIRAVNICGQPITAAGLARLSPLAGLTHLYLRDTNIRPAEGARIVRGFSKLDYLHCPPSWVAHLEGMASLRGIHFWRTTLTADLFRRLRTFPNLAVVDIGACSLKEADLLLLKEIKTLRLMHLYRVNLSEESLRRLAAQLPNCEIVLKKATQEIVTLNEGKGAAYFSLSGFEPILFKGPASEK